MFTFRRFSRRRSPQAGSLGMLDPCRYRRYGVGRTIYRRRVVVGNWDFGKACPQPPDSEPGPDCKPEIPTATDEEMGGVIQLVNVDPVSLQNARSHHTDSYDQVDDGDLIVRRGQPFKLVITFNRPFDEKSDDIRLVFETGTNPVPSKGTLVRFMLSAEDKPKEWGAMISASDGNDVTMTVFTPPDCIIGRWEFSIESVQADTDDFRAFKPDFSLPFYILFNPWCKDDTVYFNNEKLLSEYILNDTGAIFHGNYKQIGYRPWFFGQFEDGILETALFCIVKAFGGRFASMGDPIKVSRAISRIVNCNDDGGVLMGNWSGNYSGGRSPCAWTGSVAILKKYMETKESVKWGQCFVFSGLVTTICRAVGLPCRSVTNYASAHDQDASVSIDTYWDLTGGEEKKLEGLCNDSIWNFHVWNDVWMKRPDLPMGYGGWQAIDATPQEESGGVMQCGPVSLKAILNGQCDLQFDAPFIFAEVNADRVHWARTKTGDFEVLGLEKSSVGRFISTKRPDGRSAPIVREDITHEYKYDDDSDKERIAVISASRSATKAKPIYCQKTRDVKFSFIQHDHILIGDDFENKLIVENTSKQPRTVRGRIMCDAVSYTGSTEQSIKTETFQVTVKPGERQEVAMKVVADEYLDRVSEGAAMKVALIARIPETDQVQAWQDDFRLRKPNLKVELLSKSPRVKEELKLKVSLKNPFKGKSLTNCQMRIEGPGIRQAKECPLGTLASGAEWSTELEVIPQKQGTKVFIAAFECDQLNDINGTLEAEIR